MVALLISDTAAAEVKPEVSEQKATWTLGTLVFGFAVATCGLAGAVVLRVRPWAAEPGTPATGLPVDRNGLNGFQTLGLVTLILGALLITVGKAAQQNPERLFTPFQRVVERFETGIDDAWVAWRYARALSARANPDAALGFTRDRAATDVVAAVAMAFGGVGVGVGATWLAQLGVQGGFAGIGVAAAVMSVAGLLSSSRDVVLHAATLGTSIVVIASSARLDPQGRAAVIVIGLLWLVLVWATIVAARRVRLWAIMGTVAAGTMALALRDELDNTLSSLTSPGGTPRGFGDLAPLTSPFDSIDRVREVGTTWREFRSAADPGDVVPLDHTIRLAYVVIESGLLAIAYPLLFFVLARRVARRLGTGCEHAQRLKSILTVTQFAMPVLFALDVAENLSGSAAVQHITGTHRPRRDLADIAEALAVIHWLASFLKWLTIVGAVVALTAGLGWVVTRPRSEAQRADPEESDRLPPAATGRGTYRRWNSPYVTPAHRAEPPTETRSARVVLSAIVLLRASIALVLVVIIALRNPQTYDAIRVIVDHAPNRRNTSQVNFVQALLLVGLTLAAGVVIRFLGELVVRQLRGTSRPNHVGRIGHALIVLAFASVFWFALGAPGLLVPLAIYGVLELLSRPLRPRKVRSGAVTDDTAITDESEQAGGQRTSSKKVLGWSIAAAIVLVTLALIAHREGTTRDVRWVLIVVSGLIALHAAGQIVMPNFAPDARITKLFEVRRKTDATEVRSGDGAADAHEPAAPAIVSTPLIELDDQQGDDHDQDGDDDDDDHDQDGDDDHEQRTGDEPHDAQDLILLTHNDTEFVRHVGVMAAVLGSIVPIVVGAAVARSALGLIIYGDAIRRDGTDLDNQGDWILLGIGITLAVIGVVIQTRIRFNRLPLWSQSSSIAAVRLVLSLVVALYLLAWQSVVANDVIGLTRDTGAIGVLMLFVILAATIGTTITYVSAETTPVPALQLLRFRHPPFFTLAVVWLLLAGTLDDGGYHDIPVMTDRPELTVLRADAAEGETTAAGSDAVGLGLRPQQAVDVWISECAETSNVAEAVPMLFVAASGGGIRAAYWTASTLERLDLAIRNRFPDSCNPIFAASGASGGSLGLTVYVVDDLTRPGLESPNTKDRLADDYLSPTLSWFLFVDLVRPFMLWDRDGTATVDRGEMLEKSWDMPRREALSRHTVSSVGRCRGDDGAKTVELEDGSIRTSVSLQSGLRETWCLGAPLLILNGTEVSSGCRFIASVLDNGDPAVSDDPTAGTCLRPRTAEPPDSGPLGATIDLVDHLCPDQDVSLATAALLSARFPFVTPSGRVPARSCDDEAPASDDAPLRSDDPAFVVDGGYIDNSGAGPVVQLWADISTRIDRHNAARVGTANPDPGPCIVPVFLQLDNGYDFDAATKSSRPNELLVPLQAAAASRGSREAEAKQIASEIFFPEEFSGAFTAGVNRWFRVVPEAHPGIQAPLGWVLSDAAQADLNGELDAQLARAQGDDDAGTRVPAGELRQLIDVLTDDLTCTQVTDDG